MVVYKRHYWTVCNSFSCLKYIWKIKMQLSFFTITHLNQTKNQWLDYSSSLIAAWKCNRLNEHTVWKMRIFIFTDEATIQDRNNTKKKLNEFSPWFTKRDTTLFHGRPERLILKWEKRHKLVYALTSITGHQCIIFEDSKAMTHRLRAKLPRYLSINNTCDACFTTPLSKHITYGTGSRYRPCGAQLALQCPLLRGARQHRNYRVSWEHLSCNVMLCAPEHQPEEGKAYV